MPTEKLTILSLGWGVQSWTLAAMAALGEVEKPDFAIHSDTNREHKATYDFLNEWTDWLEARGVPVLSVEADESTKGVCLPLYTRDAAGSKGQLKRTCTDRWKIRPIRRKVSEILAERGLKKKEGIVKQMIGISMDEWSRMKDNGVKYIKSTFPLIDLRMTRKDCEQWLTDHNLPIPPSSSCVECPYHSLFSWYELQQGNGEDWNRAIEVDKQIRDTRKEHGYTCYLSTQGKPLTELYFGEFTEPTLFDLSEFPCDSGHCFL
jgi:hypothetical protein